MKRLTRAVVGTVAASIRLAARRLTTVSPRTANRWVFGSRSNLYIDNPMYLYEDVRRTCPHIRAVWITGDARLARRLRSEGRAAFSRASPRGIFHLLRAGVNVYASDPADTSFAFTGGALNVNLYHGLPIKQIEFDIGTPRARRVYHPSTVSDRVRSHTLYAPKWAFQDVLATSSEWAETQFRRSYQGRVGVVVQGCSPRMSAALKGEAPPASIFGVEHAVLEEIERRRGSTLLFAPTWRRYPWCITDVLGDLDELQAVLERSDTTILVKSHLFSKAALAGVGRVVDLADWIDVSAILARVDGLITDYSSIGLDAALLGKPVIWAPVDLAAYRELESPDFDLDYDRLTEGHAVTSPRELHTLLANGEWADWTVAGELSAEIWGPDARHRIPDGNSLLVQAVSALQKSS